MKQNTQHIESLTSQAGLLKSYREHIDKESERLLQYFGDELKFSDPLRLMGWRYKQKDAEFDQLQRENQSLKMTNLRISEDLASFRKSVRDVPHEDAPKQSLLSTKKQPPAMESLTKTGTCLGSEDLADRMKDIQAMKGNNDERVLEQFYDNLSLSSNIFTVLMSHYWQLIAADYILRIYIKLVMQGSFLVNDLRKVISIVDLLRDIGLGNQLSLPKVVVLGNQSSGKSSLLEQIVGLDFLPRGSGVVTRRPLELRMNNVPELAKPYAEFEEVVEKGVKRRFTNFNEVRATIDVVTDAVCGKKQQIVDRPIVLNIYAKSCPNLTIVDLPGITSIPVGEQPNNIYQITKNMALRYISEKRSIILCVIPANQDLSVSEALKILREIDPSGQRSIGCMTKIDIMNRGDDARNILKNLQVPLRYGYVGIKNRCQQDVTNNVPVEDSLKEEKKFFTTSPIYSSLPSDLFGTDSLTKKLTNILYQQIKSSMPQIFEQIKKKKKSAQEELQKLGPGVANTDAEMVNYAWKSVATFLRIFKNSLGGIKNSEYNKDPISAEIRQELNQVYQDQYDEAATEDITDKDIEKAMINFPGDSTIPGFPSIDAFLALLNPLLKKMQTPAYEINNKIHEIMEREAVGIIESVLSTKYPQFNSRFSDLIRKILDKYRKNLESYLNSLLDSELNYLYTNDLTYLVGDFNKPQNEKEKRDAVKNPLVYELRKRIDAYYKLVVRNLRDLIPKQIFNFLIYKCLRELQFQAFQFTSDVNKLKEWLNEPSEVRLRRLECTKAIKVFQESEKRIRMDPDISKLVRESQKTSKFYQKFQMKSPEQVKEEEEKRVSEFYKLTAQKSIKENQTKPKAPEPRQPERRPDSKPSDGSGQSTPKINGPPPVIAKKEVIIVSPSPINPNKQPQTPTLPIKNNPPPAPQKIQDFSNFFGGTKPEPKPPVVIPPQPIQTKPIAPGGNTGPKMDFNNFFNTNSGTTATNPNSGTTTTNPSPKTTPPPEEKKPEEKKKTFNKLFGI